MYLFYFISFFITNIWLFWIGNLFIHQLWYQIPLSWLAHPPALFILSPPLTVIAASPAMARSCSTVFVPPLSTFISGISDFQSNSSAISRQSSFAICKPWTIRLSKTKSMSVTTSIHQTSRCQSVSSRVHWVVEFVLKWAFKSARQESGIVLEGLSSLIEKQWRCLLKTS